MRAIYNDVLLTSCMHSNHFIFFLLYIHLLFFACPSLVCFSIFRFRFYLFYSFFYSSTFSFFVNLNVRTTYQFLKKEFFFKEWEERHARSKAWNFLRETFYFNFCLCARLLVSISFAVIFAHVKCQLKWTQWSKSAHSTTSTPSLFRLKSIQHIRFLRNY